jgi:hypothetical protein
MDILVKIVGIVIVLMAVLYIAHPGVMLRLMEFFKKGYRIYLAAIVRLALGVVFLLGARECSVTWLIATFGILFLLGGLLIPLLGRKRTTAILDYYGKRPLWLLRVLALVALVIGLLIIYAA